MSQWPTFDQTLLKALLTSTAFLIPSKSSTHASTPLWVCFRASNRPFRHSIRHIGLYAKIMVAQLPWWDYAGKYAKHMLKEWINKRLTRRIEIKTKLNIVDENEIFFSWKPKSFIFFCFSEQARQKTITLHFNSVR